MHDLFHLFAVTNLVYYVLTPFLLSLCFILYVVVQFKIDHIHTILSADCKTSCSRASAWKLVKIVTIKLETRCGVANTLFTVTITVFDVHICSAWSIYLEVLQQAWDAFGFKTKTVCWLCFAQIDTCHCPLRECVMHWRSWSLCQKMLRSKLLNFWLACIDWLLYIVHAYSAVFSVRVSIPW